MRGATVEEENLSLSSHSLHLTDGGRFMGQIDIAWLAGIIEGEGCLTLQKPPSRTTQHPHPIIKVAMCDEEVVNRLREITGVGNTRKQPPPKKANWSQAWTWEVAVKKDVARILLAVYPLMSTRKQEQIAGLAEFVSYRRLK